MNKAPLVERLEFFKFKYSGSMFDQARRVLRHISDEKIGNDHPLHHALWTSFVVLYGKPFKQRRAIRLDECVVPADYQEEHNAIMTFRDKMYAHSDLDLLEQESRDPLNRVMVSLDGGKVQFAFHFLFPKEAVVKRYGELLEELIRSTSYHAKKRWDAWVKRKRITMNPSKRYTINTAADSDDILVEFSPVN